MAVRHRVLLMILSCRERMDTTMRRDIEKEADGGRGEVGGGGGGGVTCTVYQRERERLRGHHSRGRKGGSFRVDTGQPFTDPGTKLDGSFISIHNPSNWTFPWNCAIMSLQ